MKNKVFKYCKIKVTKVSAYIDYGLRNIMINVYLYAFINALVPILIGKRSIGKNSRSYRICTDFNRNYFKGRFSCKIEMRIGR